MISFVIVSDLFFETRETHDAASEERRTDTMTQSLVNKRRTDTMTQSHRSSHALLAPPLAHLDKS